MENGLEKLVEEQLIKVIFSNPKKKTYDYKKSVLQKIEDEGMDYQIESFTEEQAFHKNIVEAALEESLESLIEAYKQAQIWTEQGTYHMQISKKGKLLIKKTGEGTPVKAVRHNKEKQHLLQDGVKVDFMVHLGIMDQTGKVRHKWYDKFKQINRYLEFIEDSLPHLETENPTIIDFGCGKSYLTFALYYYLVKVKGWNVTIIGLDLKEKVIADLNILKDQLGYEGLEFRVGDIAMFDYDRPIDMVISLHACNLATDYALEKAVKWNAKVILAVPCCHKEIHRQIQIKGTVMEPVLSYGLIEERMSALMTDGLRGELLKAVGYEVQIMEFIDMSHTPKNIMIRAYRSIEESWQGNYREDGSHVRLTDAYKKMCETYGLKPTLEALLKS